MLQYKRERKTIRHRCNTFGWGWVKKARHLTGNWETTQDPNKNKIGEKKKTQHKKAENTIGSFTGPDSQLLHQDYNASAHSSF